MNLTGKAAQEAAIVAKGLLTGDAADHLSEFLTGAQERLSSFSPAGELVKVCGPSSFRWAQLRETVMTIYIIANLAEVKAYRPWLSVLMEMALLELMAAEGDLPVNVVLDEATNLPIDLVDKVTAMRAYGLRTSIYFQQKAHYEKVRSPQDFKVIFGESDLLQFFSVKDPELAEMIERVCGTRHIDEWSESGIRTPNGAGSASVSRGRVPLVTRDYLLFKMPRGHQIVFADGVPYPIYCLTASVGDISTYTKLLDPNPLERNRKPPGTRDIRIERRFGRLRVAAYRRNYRAMFPRWWDTLKWWIPPSYSYFAPAFMAAMWFGMLEVFDHYGIRSAGTAWTAVKYEAGRGADLLVWMLEPLN